MIDPNLKSFIPVEVDSHFSIQNLPYGVFRAAGGRDGPRVGVAIGDFVVDLAVLESRGLITVPGATASVFDHSCLNPFMQLGTQAWTAVRERLGQLLVEDEPTLRDDHDLRALAIHKIEDVQLMMPVDIRDYTDFYSSRFHATNVGTMMRGADNALQENWLHLPVAYHGRASSIVVSGTDVQRPVGQTGAGQFGPSKAMDFELEMGFFVGPGSTLGKPIPIAEAVRHIFGMVLVNDWSARDVQKWEYVPLGPFLSKNLATSISPWVVPLAALEPFRTSAPEQSPAPLPYLRRTDDFTYDIQLEVYLSLPGTPPQRITSTNFRHLYWTISQQLAHHSITGCNMQTGDLLASGTISGPEKESRGCLLERTWRGAEPLELGDGQTRTFLEDHDRVTLTGFCQGDGYRVGFGEVTGQLLPATEVS
ncbi:MAG: fumarylacetoacetase [Pirellulales bacterium]|nr:fumarylacetoacetase [Pirellulales bacterium]